MPVVIKERCPQDHPCPLVKACPVGAIKQKHFQAPSLDRERCIECGICTKYCPYQALTERVENVPARDVSSAFA